MCGVSSLELSWRPPTKNADRIERYKLMIATGTGVVKDVYQVCVEERGGAGASRGGVWRRNKDLACMRGMGDGGCTGLA